MLPNLTVVLAILPLALAATTCSVSSSSPWPFPANENNGGGGGGGGDSVTDVCAQFKNDPTDYKACTDAALAGQCNASGGSGCSDSTATGTTAGSDDLIANAGDDLISSGSSSDSGDGGLIKRLLHRRAVTLTCTSSEECYQYTDGSLLCYNLATGDYHDDVNGHGNYLDGTYTGPSGDSSSATTTSSGSSASSSATGSSGRASSASSSSASAAAASATAASGAGAGVRVGALGGALGLVAAFVV